jgi:AraC-like DNA-binding protein
MIYQQFKPHPALSAYIDAYWTSGAGKESTAPQKILPDGCIDIIVNLGEDCTTDNILLQHEQFYLVGTMLHFKMVDMKPGTRVWGIRFKPAAFSAFYQFTSLHQLTDRTVEWEKKLSPGLQNITSTRYLDQFFLNKLLRPAHNLPVIIEDIKAHKGRMSVDALAKRHFTTAKQLERYFKEYIGASPKEFINFIRYQFVAPVIKGRTVLSLDEIAIDHGYYDHAHLANEVKKYTGLTPSQL